MKPVNQLVFSEITNYEIIHGGDFELLKRQLLEDQDIQDRKNMVGHVTSSFCLLNPELTKILMIHHINLDCWLCPGGHFEGQSLIESAIRELLEETGYDKKIDLSIFGILPIDVDTHMIPDRPSKNEGPHYHHDFLYIGVASENFVPSPQLEEVHAAQWFGIQEVCELTDTRARLIGQRVKYLISFL